MLDIRRLRAEGEVVSRALSRRDADGFVGTVDEVLGMDEVRRSILSEVNDLKAQRNEVSKRIGELKREGADATDLIEEMKGVGERISDLDDEVARADKRIRELLLVTPNLPLEEVPEGGEENNAVVRTVGMPADFSFEPKPHWDLAGELDILDLPRGSKISGSGFPVLKGMGARLQRCLIDFMLDIHTKEHGYTEVRVPYLVTRDALTATGQLPKFADESYQTEKDDLWLIPTAEVPVTNLHAHELLTAEDLPVRYTAYSPCFRREAGAAGADTRGLLRLHQFDKVELVRYETPERSRKALDELTAEAESILQRLDLHYRVVTLAAGDLGFSAEMTYDLEVWAPGVRQWLEVSSCSTFGDFQARRAGLRYRPTPGEKPRFVHTLNGSALALPRLIVAILETYQQLDGTVRVPEALQERIGLSTIQP
ncbi:MAG: serine--tRNA ligase [Gemmatimonadota bacterium]|nr:serine--tRNA ligase [Gemmatimonadota bacterium]